MFLLCGEAFTLRRVRPDFRLRLFSLTGQSRPDLHKIAFSYSLSVDFVNAFMNASVNVYISSKNGMIIDRA
jgi:hypothetical protein